MSERIVVRLFGPFSASVDGAPLAHLRSRKGEWLLALLSLRLGRPVAREWLASTLWPESAREHAFLYLRQSLTDLRHALGEAAELLSSPTPQTLRLLPEGVQVDAAVFDALVADGSAQALEEAAELYTGPLLEGCAEEWALPERTAREEQCLAALERLAELALTDGLPTRAIHFLRRLVAADPLREDAHRSLMRALADCGDWAAVRQAYRDLRLLLRKEVNAEPDAETVALYERLRAQASRAPALPHAAIAQPAGPPRRLPVPLTRLVGREEEVQAVVGLVGRERLVTLTGSGGVGKTRLAIAVGEALLAEPELTDALCPDGVWMVELASLSDPSLVLNEVARALGVREHSGIQGVEMLAKALGSRSLLLILDNCEHLLGACAELAEGLLRACAGVRVLATGRQALGITGEMAYRVPSLSLPDAELSHSMTAEPVQDYAAVRLFAERAAAAEPSFRVTDRNAGAVVQVSRRLDGIPLAIEMAAARVRALPVEQMAERLDDGFRPLLTGSRTAPARHQTLQATIDWSYNLLTEPERVLLARLSVFAGGWTLEAAEAVCSDPAGASTQNPKPEIRNESVLSLLASLVDKCLVLFEEREDGEGRYRLLETIRQYAWDRSEASGDLERLRQRHLAYFLAMAEEAGPHLVQAKQGYWLDRLQTEHGNLRTALASSSGLDRLRLASALGDYWHLHGPAAEGEAWLTMALEGSEGEQAPAGLRAQALLALATLVWRQGDYERMEVLTREALDQFQKASNPGGAAFALTGLGIWAETVGDLNMGKRLLSEGVAKARELANPRLVALSLAHLGFAEVYTGDLSAARASFAQALELGTQYGSSAMIAYAMLGLGTVLRHEGDPAGALPLLREGLSRRYEMQQFADIPDLVEAIAYVAAAAGDGVRAARLLGAAEAQRERLRVAIWPSRRPDWECAVATARAGLTEGAFAAAWAEGRAMPLDDAVAYALSDDDAPAQEC